MKLSRLMAGVAAATLVGVPVAVAGAAGQHGGKIQLFVWGAGKNPKAMIVGAIGDYGTATSVDKNGKINPNGRYERLGLGKGSLLVDGKRFNAASNRARPSLTSKTTCSASFSFSAPAPIVSGTGRYKGASGTLMLHATFAGVSPRKHGKCPKNQNTGVGYLSVTGTGTVNFS